MIRRNWLYPFRRRGFWINPYWMKFMALSLLATSCIWILASHTRFHINRTDSAPYHAFVCMDFLRVGYGDYVSIEGHQADYFGELHYTKKILGIPGDIIEMTDAQLLVGGRLIGTFFEETSQGLKLTPQESAEIPIGFVFVAGEHSHSFDSRYKEFGLVPVGQIKGRCFGFGKRKVVSL